MTATLACADAPSCVSHSTTFKFKYTLANYGGSILTTDRIIGKRDLVMDETNKNNAI